MGVGFQRHAPAALPPRKDPVPIVEEAGWAPGPVWTGVENLASHRDSIPGLFSNSVLARHVMWPGPVSFRVGTHLFVLLCV